MRLFFPILLFFPFFTFSQGLKDSLRFSFYADLYYGFNPNRPTESMNAHTPHAARNEQFGLGMAYVKSVYKNKGLTATLSLQTGDYPALSYANYTHKTFFSHIQEANISWRFAKKWSAEVGVMPSHLGYEGNISHDLNNYTLTVLGRISSSSNTGVQINYHPGKSGKLFFNLTNGFNLLVDNNRQKSVGWGFSWQLSEIAYLGYGGYFGNDQPQGLPQKPLLAQDLHTVLTYGKYEAVVSVAWYARENLHNNARSDGLGMNFMSSYQISNKYLLNATFDYFDEQSLGMLAAPEGTSYAASSYALNVVFCPRKELKLRLEGKFYNAKEKIFKQENGKFTKQMPLLLAAISCRI